MKKKNIYKRLITIFIIVIFVFIIASIISYNFFKVANPIASGIGLFKVTFTDCIICEVQNDPKVIFFKSNSEIIKAMEEHGYIFIKEEQMGSMVVFEKDGIKYYGTMDGGLIAFFVASDIRES